VLTLISKSSIVLMRRSKLPLRQDVVEFEACVDTPTEHDRIPFFHSSYAYRRVEVES